MVCEQITHPLLAVTDARNQSRFMGGPGGASPGGFLGAILGSLGGGGVDDVRHQRQAITTRRRAFGPAVRL